MANIENTAGRLPREMRREKRGRHTVILRRTMRDGYIVLFDGYCVRDTDDPNDAERSYNTVRKVMMVLEPTK